MTICGIGAISTFYIKFAFAFGKVIAKIVKVAILTIKEKIKKVPSKKPTLTDKSEGNIEEDGNDSGVQEMKEFHDEKNNVSTTEQFVLDMNPGAKGQTLDDLVRDDEDSANHLDEIENKRPGEQRNT